jgi:hypothetical protein
MVNPFRSRRKIFSGTGTYAKTIITPAEWFAKEEEIMAKFR